MSTLIDKYPVSDTTVLIDRLVVNVLSVVPVVQVSSEEYYRVADSLYSKGFKKRGGEGLSLQLSLPHYDGVGRESIARLRFKPKKGFISKRVGTLTFTMKLHVNGMQLLRHHLGVSKNVESLDGKRNGLPSSIITSTTPEELQEIQIKALNSCIIRIIQDVRSAFPFHPDKYDTPDFFVQIIEVTQDFPDSDALTVLPKIHTAVKPNFPKSNEDTYRNRLTNEYNCKSFTLQTRNGQKLKVYAKASDLVRLEWEYQGKHLRYKKLLGTNNINLLSQDAIKEALCVLSQPLRTVLDVPCGTTSTSDDAVWHLIHGIARGSKNHEVSKQLLFLLCTEGQLTSQGISAIQGCNYQVLNNLKKKGILDSSAKGVYTPRPEVNMERLKAYAKLFC